MRAELDHLVVACASLEQGCDWVESLLGARPGGGGAHPLMGTHNRLLRLGDAAYLEVIAPDPAASDPVRPRWFGLDEPVLRRSLAEQGPRLLTWVVRSTDIAAATAASPVPLGPSETATRGTLRWRITVPPDGALPEGGAMPTVIEWPPGAEHPVIPGLPDHGLRLVSLRVRHPDPVRLRRALDAIGLAPGGVEVEAGPVDLSALVNRGAGTAVL